MQSRLGDHITARRTELEDNGLLRHVDGKGSRIDDRQSDHDDDANRN